MNHDFWNFNQALLVRLLSLLGGITRLYLRVKAYAEARSMDKVFKTP